MTEANPAKKIYFVSDLHLGIPNHEASLQREKFFCKWLDEISKDAGQLFILGDLFDFWYEYKQVVPRGFVRVLGKLAELTDAGLPVTFFTGNHDQWMTDYFEKELNIPILRKPQHYEWNGKKFLIGHGDGLGPGDYSYKFLKTIFTNPVLRWLFTGLHPNIAVALGRKWSRSNRLLNGTHEEKFLGEEKEWLIMYARNILKTEHIDCFIFGHRHLALDYNLSDNSRYINLGDWLTFYTYAVFDGTKLEMNSYKDKNLY